MTSPSAAAQPAREQAKADQYAHWPIRDVLVVPTQAAPDSLLEQWDWLDDVVGGEPRRALVHRTGLRGLWMGLPVLTEECGNNDL